MGICIAWVATGCVPGVAGSPSTYPTATPDVPDEGTSRIPEVEPALRGALRALSERQRIAVFLTYGMDWTRQEVADLLDISVNSVGSHLERGMKNLRGRLGVDAHA